MRKIGGRKIKVIQACDDVPCRGSSTEDGKKARVGVQKNMSLSLRKTAVTGLLGVLTSNCK